MFTPVLSYLQRADKAVAGRKASEEDERSSPPEPSPGPTRAAGVVLAKGGEAASEELRQLDFFTGPYRGLPNVVVRSALFGCRTSRAICPRTVVAGWKGAEISYEGISLNQRDESVWMQLIQYWMWSRPESYRVRFRGSDMLRDLSWGAKGKKGGLSGHAYTRLRESLYRLRSINMSLSLPKEGRVYSVVDGLINELTFAEEAPDIGFISCVLNKNYVSIYATQLTRIRWETRLRLRCGLPSWLHRYILSHTSPHFVSLDKLHALCGISAERKHFRRPLRKAMDELKAVGGVVAHYEIRHDTLIVVRPKAGRYKKEIKKKEE
jgi:hypothetical protein